MSGFSLLCCVVNDGSAGKVLACAEKYGIKGATVFKGRGTAPSRLLEALGLSEVRKDVVQMIVRNELAATALKGISNDMGFHKPHHGIAYSMPISEFIRSGNEGDGNKKTIEVKDKVYNVIYVIVDRGNGECVVDVANKAGARGATIVNGRGADANETKRFFNMEVVPEKEEVIIITKATLKDSIVSAIRDGLKIEEPGNGVLFVMDVNEAYGLYE